MTHKILLDTDPGIDDAAAIAIALTDKQFDVQLLSTVAGNVGVDKTTNNALKLVEFLKATKMVKVAGGANQPLLKPFKDASYIHGKTGMAGWNFPDPMVKPLTQSATEAMYDVLRTSTEPLTLVLTGAFTNAALLLREHPDIMTKIAGFVVMGGSISGGNMNSVAEFNIFTDPHAAKIIFEAGLPVTMIGLDVTLKALLSYDNIARLGELNETGRMLQAMISHYGDNKMTGKPMHDVNTLFYLSEPDAFKTVDYWIDVVTDGPATGATVADTLHESHDGKTNVSVAIDIDVKRFNKWFIDKISAISI